MRLVDLTLPTPAENLACDEALLEHCEEGWATEVLRFWEPAEYFVVLGYANRAAAEANLEFCRQSGFPVLRRCSGGGTVLQGPGCLNYSLVLRIAETGPLRGITTTNNFVMHRHQAALCGPLGLPVEIRGYTDLALSGLKFSGNAQRRRKHYLLFHGSFLLGLDLRLVERALPMPSKQPEYREDRPHLDFLVNLDLPAQAVKRALSEAWRAAPDSGEVPHDRIEELVRRKYGREEWNLRF
jgi:lipoate---protein ligase